VPGVMAESEVAEEPNELMTTILGGEPGHIQSWRWNDYGCPPPMRVGEGTDRGLGAPVLGGGQRLASSSGGQQVQQPRKRDASESAQCSSQRTLAWEPRQLLIPSVRRHVMPGATGSNTTKGAKPGNVAAELAQLAEQAVAQAAAEGLILHRSNTNKTGFKGVKKNVSKTSYRSRKTGAPRPLPFFLLLLLQPKRQHSAMPAASCDVLLACSVVVLD